MLERFAREPSPASPQTLQFESVPSGADVRTARGQACQTPCTLTVVAESQSVTFTKNGVLPQTVAITLSQPPDDHSFFSSRPPPTLTPNPVKAALLMAPPPPPPPMALAPPPVQRAPPPREVIPWFPS